MAKDLEAGAAPRFARLIVPLMLTEMAAALGLTMLFAALRRLAVDLGSPTAAGWMITAFILSTAVGGALLGRVGDVIGRRRVLLAVLMAGLVGSLIACMTRSVPLLIFARALQGLVGAALPLCFGLVRERAPIDMVPRGIGLIAATASVSSGLGLLAGGIVVDLFDWPAVFAVLALVCLLAFLGVLLFIAPDTVRAGQRIEDALGGLLFAPAIVGLLLGIERIGHRGAGDPANWLWFGLALALLAVWVWRELSVEHPLISVRLLMVPEIAMANLAMVFTALGAFQGGQMMSLFGQQSPVTGVGLGLSATGAAMLLTPINIVAGFVYARFAGLAAAWGPRNVALCGALMLAASFTSLILWHQAIWQVEIALAIQMIGLGMVFVTVPLVVVAACPPDRVSESTGMVVVIRSTAMAIGAQTVATLLSTHGAGGAAGAFPTEETWRIVFGYGVLMSLIGAVVALGLPRKLAMGKSVDVH